MKTLTKTLLATALLTSVAAANATVTGNVGVVSKYVLRGITQTYGGHKGTFCTDATKPETCTANTPESDGPALQGGLDYTNDSGFYAGYWFSSIDYSYKDLKAGYDTNYKPKGQKSVENDFYAGYNGKVADFGYTVGGTVYYYLPGWESTGVETKLGLNYGPVSFTAQTLLNDVTFGNKYDTYYLTTYTKALPKDFTFTGQVGLYSYGKKSKTAYGSELITKTATNDDGKEVGTKGLSFRHATLGLTHPLGATGATMGLQYIIGGDNRYGIKQDNTIVGSVSMTF